MDFHEEIDKTESFPSTQQKRPRLFVSGILSWENLDLLKQT